MKNIAFVLWMTLYPLVDEACRYLSFLEGKRYTNDVEAFSGLISLVVYIWIAIKLYEKREASREF